MPTYLASGLSAAEDAEVDHQPGQCQAERLLPLHAPAGLQRRRDVQGLPVPEVLGGRRLLALLFIARAVAVQGAGGPRQGVLRGRGGVWGKCPLSAWWGELRGDEGKSSFLSGACLSLHCAAWG